MWWGGLQVINGRLSIGHTLSQPSLACLLHPPPSHIPNRGCLPPPHTNATAIQPPCRCKGALQWEWAMQRGDGDGTTRCIYLDPSHFENSGGGFIRCSQVVDARDSVGAGGGRERAGTKTLPAMSCRQKVPDGVCIKWSEEGAWVSSQCRGALQGKKDSWFTHPLPTPKADQRA